MSDYKLELSSMHWTTVPGAGIQLRRTIDGMGVDVRDEPEPDPCPEPSWWPPVQGDVFFNVNTGSRYFTVAENSGDTTCVGTTGQHFAIREFGHGDMRGGPLWRLIVPGKSRGGPILPNEGLL